jgi:hypothetical protein
VLQQRHEERNAQVDREEAKDYNDEQKRMYDNALMYFDHIKNERDRQAAARRVVAAYMAHFTDYAAWGGGDLRVARARLAGLNEILAEYAIRATPADKIASVNAAQRKAAEEVRRLEPRGGATRRSSLPRLLAMRSSSAKHRTYSRRRRA